MFFGIAGEVRAVVTDARGDVKIDTGFQKNLILNQGLDFFGGSKGSEINGYCAIGSGNSAPAITQTKLDAYIAQASGTDKTSDYSYVDKGDNLYRMWEQKKYRFTGLSNVNISEVGLVSTGTTSTNYYLTTRALIKDGLGAPTSISVKTGETLDIYYKIYKVVDTSDKAFVINVLDGNGGAVPYNIVIRPQGIGSWNTPVSRTFAALDNSAVSSLDIVGKTVNIVDGDRFSQGGYSPYESSTYKLKKTLAFSLNEANMNIRRITSVSADGYQSTFPLQMRFGRVSDDAPLTKTANDTLKIPLEFSWGRYEGAL